MESQAFLSHFQAAFEAGQLLKCTLSKPSAAAPPGLKNIYLRMVALKSGLKVAFNYRYATRDEVKNLPLPEALALLEQLLGHQWLNAVLFAATEEISLGFDKNGRASLRRQPTARAEAPELAHNRAKQRLLDPAAPWLHALGICNAKGEVLASAQDKWRQINKYLEIIENLLQQQPLPSDAHIADMGSGKGYLSFALYDYLHLKKGLQPRITGIELRPGLVEHCNKVAQSVGFQKLEFVAANIAEYRPERLDMLIALHACDTATDLALATGIAQKAAIIVAAPCCHKQVRRDMQAHNEMAPLLRHGILEERQAEILTDGIRALLLEAQGYKTSVFEFISTEHTAKNLMITATANPRASANQRQSALDKVAALKTSFGIGKHHLETLLDLEAVR
jgi:SAM-dependent methyltransferase